MINSYPFVFLINMKESKVQVEAPTNKVSLCGAILIERVVPRGTRGLDGGNVI